MDWNKYNASVQSWIKGVEQYHGMDLEQTLECAEKIKQFGESTNDPMLLGYSYYYIAETYYIKNDIEHFFEYIMQGVDYLQRSQQWQLTAKACNLLGIASNNQGNAPFALDYYLSGASVSEKNHLLLEKAIIEYNIGSIYMTYQEYNRAIHYLENSWSALRMLSEDEQTLTYKKIIYLSLASCYMELHNMRLAEYYLNQARSESSNSLNEMEEVYFLCIQARFYKELPDVEKRDNCIREIEERLSARMMLMDIFDDLYLYCQMLLEINKYEELWNVLTILDGMVSPGNLVHMQRKLLTIKIEYYKKMGDDAKVQQAAAQYYELSQKKEREEKFVTGSMLNVRFSLEEARKKQRKIEAENQKLQYQSETDSLTGIANRIYLNREAEAAFQRCLSEGKYFGVEMLDIDYFKEYNDNYGHQQGDRCLVTVSTELKKLTEYGNIFCARYGGDEFVLIYENYPPEMVERFAKELKQNMGELQIEHKFSKALPMVTLSQGICCDIPRKGDKAWDFLHSADAMLYRVKRDCRNGIALGGCRREVDTSDGSGTKVNGMDII